jgi:hypothetical protein
VQRLRRFKRSMADQNSLLKISLDELRMQMLGTQVAFGFQLQSLFQERVDIHSSAIRAAAAVGLVTIVMTLGLLIAGPAVHRLAERGSATERTRRLSASLARSALTSLSISLAAAVFVPCATHFGVRGGVLAAALTAGACLLAWQVWGMLLRGPGRGSKEGGSVPRDTTSLHDKIDYLLTETRVILPGAQALLGFQLGVTLMKAFEALPETAKAVHFAALSSIALVVVLLIAPAAIHRIAFDGDDVEAFLRIGSRIVTGAMIPLSFGISAEMYVAAVRILPASSAPLQAAVGTSIVLAMLWYVFPCVLRAARSQN